MSEELKSEPTIDPTEEDVELVSRIYNNIAPHFPDITGSMSKSIGSHKGLTNREVAVVSALFSKYGQDLESVNNYSASRILLTIPQSRSMGNAQFSNVMRQVKTKLVLHFDLTNSTPAIANAPYYRNVISQGYAYFLSYAATLVEQEL